MILCHDINERNLKIASEVIKLHKKYSCFSNFSRFE